MRTGAPPCPGMVVMVGVSDGGGAPVPEPGSFMAGPLVLLCGLYSRLDGGGGGILRGLPPVRSGPCELRVTKKPPPGFRRGAVVVVTCCCSAARRRRAELSTCPRR